MAKNHDGLREHFDQQLIEIWEEWLEMDFSGSPFKDLDENNRFWNNAAFSHSVGFMEGVSAAMGWSLSRPKGLVDKAPGLVSRESQDQ